MFKTKRRRAVVLALIAFFCTASVTYVAVDWKRFGGGFLAFFKGGKGDAVGASTGRSPGSKAVQMAQGDTNHPNSPTLPLVASATSRKHTSGVGGGANGHKSDDDLFKYGDPAAGGIPPGNFIVAQNDTPGGGNNGGAGFAPLVGAPAAPETGSPAPTGGAGGGPGVSSPAPAPAGTGTGDGGLGGGTGSTPAPPAATPPAGSPPAATPPAATPPAGSPPAASPPAATPPAPAPTQSGTTDDPGTPPPPSPPIDSPPPPSTNLPPVSAVPEASSLAMMGLGALFLAVAAARKRKQA